MSKLTRVYLYEIITAVIILIVSFLFTKQIPAVDNIYRGTLFTYAQNEKITVKSDDKLDYIKSNDVLSVKTVLPAEIDDGYMLAFYSVHQQVSVCVGDKEIFSFKKLEGELSKTPGNNWNFVSIPAELSGNILTINLTSEYDATSGKVPRFYFGEGDKLIQNLLAPNIVFCFISFLMFVIGVVTIVCWLFMRTKVKIDNQLFYLGLFSAMGAIWSSVETYIPIFVFGNNSLMSRFSFLALILLPYPFLKFVSAAYDMKKFLPARILRVAAILNFIIQTSLCYLNIYDMREMVIVSHILIGLGAAVITPMTIIRCCRKDENGERPYAHIFAVSMIVIGVILDVLRYYYSNILNTTDASFFIRLGLFVYIIILGIDSLKRISKMLIASERAEKLEKVAYTDPLTGLGNRTAYLKLISDISQEMLPEYSVIGLDINNLKHINDTYGHSFGDRYIMFCAGIILKTIGEFGNVFRIGGDEFCVVAKELDAAKLDEVFIDIQRLVNEKKHEFDGNIGIAHGFASYDLHSDKSLNDTLNRADKRMYENKRLMKSCPQ